MSSLAPLSLLALAAVQGAGIGDEESPYAQWRLGPPTDPSWFPIGVWLQEPSLARRYEALGVNTYVGLWEGPTEAQLDALRAAGMKVVCGLNRVSAGRLDDPSIIAWMLPDEPDNREGRGPRKTTDEIHELYDRLKRRDPDRPVWLNLGQGVANDEWVGRGAKRSDYPAYVRASDIVSFDVYPVTNIRREDGENYLWYVAKGVRRLRTWGEDRQVVWNFIECTRVHHPTKRATPDQVRAEVWMSLIAGSRGLVYFCHEFTPKVSAAALLQDREMCAAVKRINAEVLGFAPLLNRPTVPGRVTIASSNPAVPVRAMLKEKDGAYYLFAIGMRNEATTATFRIEGMEAATIDVVGEDRTVEAPAGEFEDAFAPHERHVYRFDA